MTIFRPLIPYLKRQRGRIIAGFIAIMASTGCSVLQPYILRLAVDHLRQHMSLSALNFYVLLYLAAAAGQAFFMFVQRSTVNRVSRYLEYELRNDAFHHLQSLDQGFYGVMHTGDLMARLTNDLNAVRQ